MKILMCCHLPLNAKFGGAKVYIETAHAYKELGHEVDLFGYEEIAGITHEIAEGDKIKSYPIKLFQFIQEKQNDYDVIEYEYKFLPYKRSEFSSDLIMVARSTLLIHHLSYISFPHFKTIRGLASRLLKSSHHKEMIEKEIEHATFCLKEADYINVPNFSDQNILQQFGIAKERVIVSPYGITEKRVQELQSDLDKSKNKKIAFVGTFDKRKGCVEFPKIIQLMEKNHPEITFKLIGTKGMFPTKESVLSHFPKKMRSKIEVIPTFLPEKLGELLSDCKLGLFPSHLESFGFGLLELFAARLPSVSYEVPGPDLIAPKDLLVKRGDVVGLVNKLSELLKSEHMYNKAQSEMSDQVKKYNWHDQAQIALNRYFN